MPLISHMHIVLTCEASTPICLMAWLMFLSQRRNNYVYQAVVCLRFAHRVPTLYTLREGHGLTLPLKEGYCLAKSSELDQRCLPKRG